MNKIQKLRYIHSQIMIASQQLRVLTDKITEEENPIAIQVFAELAHSLSLRIWKMNEKTGRMFKF